MPISIWCVCDKRIEGANLSHEWFSAKGQIREDTNNILQVVENVRSTIPNQGCSTDTCEWGESI